MHRWLEQSRAIVVDPRGLDEIKAKLGGAEVTAIVHAHAYRSRRATALLQRMSGAQACIHERIGSSTTFPSQAAMLGSTCRGTDGGRSSMGALDAGAILTGCFTRRGTPGSVTFVVKRRRRGSNTFTGGDTLFPPRIVGRKPWGGDSEADREVAA